MAKDFIRIDATATSHIYARMLKETVIQLRRCRDDLTAMKAAMEHNIDQTDYADVESLLSIEVGYGDDVYNLVAGTVTALAAADVVALMARVG